MNFEEMYKAKLQTAAEVAENLQSGWLIGTDANASQPDGLLNAFAEQVRKTDLHGIKVFTLNDVYPYAFYSDADLAKRITGISWFSGKGARGAVNGGFADYIPTNYSDTPSHIRREYDYDAVCIAVSPMDKHGYFSCGTASSLMQAYQEKARHIYVEVNRFVPRAVRGYQLHVSEVDAIIENDHELPVLPASELDETSRTIGNYIAELIPDGACIQLGIGASRTRRNGPEDKARFGDSHGNVHGFYGGINCVRRGKQQPQTDSSGHFRYNVCLRFKTNLRLH